MMLRIITGSFKGRKIKVSRNWSGRPTSDRVKEALFNILGNTVPGSKFLDLYAGCGNIGIEALSRGASMVIFVERDYQAVQAIYNNLRLLSSTSNVRVIRKDVLVTLKQLGNAGECFDVIFLDPPYEHSLGLITIEKIQEYSLLNPDGILIAESSKKEVLPSKIKDLILVKHKAYGDTLLSFYKEVYKEG